MNYVGTTINNSPTIVMTVGDGLKAAQGIAVAFDENGDAVLPEAGANVAGIALFTSDDALEKGDEITVQIKDIGSWVAAGEIKAGDEVSTDAEGKAVKSADGNFIVGTALSSVTKAGSIVKVQITKSGYKGAASAEPEQKEISLKDLKDVDPSLSPTEGQVLKYDSGTSLWKAKEDSTGDV